MNPDFLKKLAEITAALRSGITLGGDPLGELQKRATQTGEDFGYNLEKMHAQAGYADSHPKSERAQLERMRNAYMLALQIGKFEKPELRPAIKANGRIYADVSHPHAYMRAGVDVSKPTIPKNEGYVDSNNKWYSRQAAEKLIDRFMSKAVKAQVAERSRQAGKPMGITTEDMNGKLYANRGTKADEPMTLADLDRIMAKKKGGAALDSVVSKLPAALQGKSFKNDVDKRIRGALFEKALQDERATREAKRKAAEAANATDYGLDKDSRAALKRGDKQRKTGIPMDSVVVHPLADAIRREGKVFHMGDNAVQIEFRGKKYRGEDGQRSAYDEAVSRIPHQVPPSAEQLHKLLTENKGFTVDPRTGETVSSGYAVGGGNQAGILLQKNLEDLSPKQLQFWLDQNAHKIAPDQALGGWVDEQGVAYIEPSTKVDDLNAAQRLGNERGEKAIWDHANKAEIPLKAQKDEAAASHADEMRDVLNKWHSVWNDYSKTAGEVRSFADERRKSLAEALRSPDHLPVTPVYHATRSHDFDTFDPGYGQTGSHFGTREQSRDIVSLAPRVGESAPRTFEAQLHLKNPLRLRDQGSFMPHVVTDQLVEKGLLTPDEAALIDEKSINGEAVMNSAIHEALAKKGYDGIVYLNRHEGHGFDDMPNSDAKWELVDQMNRDHGLTDEDFKTKHPKARDSYIAFKPEQIKVKNTYTPRSPYMTKFNQGDIARPNGASPQKVADVEELAYKAYKGPQFTKWLQAGQGMGRWYDTRKSQGRAIDALGDKLGPQAFNDLIDHMAASTAMSRPENNLRRASWWRALNLKGLLNPDELRTSRLAAPEGLGHIANKAHHAAIADLVQNGVLNLLKNPKPAGFAENLKMNWRPYTNDTRMATAALQVQPKLSLGLAGKQGDATPRKWAYAPMERAAQRVATEVHGRGLVDSPPDGVDPTAAWQAQVWGGIGASGNRGMGLKPSKFAGNFDDILDKLLARSAKMWGVSPTKANELFWKGQPLDLPLDASLLKGPAELRKPRKK